MSNVYQCMYITEKATHRDVISDVIVMTSLRKKFD